MAARPNTRLKPSLSDAVLIEMLRSFKTVNKQLMKLDEPTLDRLIALERGGKDREWMLARLITRSFMLKKKAALRALRAEAR